MRKWRGVISSYFKKSLSVSSNIWFILGLSLIDFLLCRECVPFSRFLGCQKMLDCVLNKINVKLLRVSVF